MYIRNGVWAISSKAEKKRVFTGSLRVCLFIFFVLIGSLPVVVVNRIAGADLEQRQIQARVNELQYQGNTLSRQLTKSGYMESQMEMNLDGEMDQLADIYDGRILLVDNSFKIVKDTYQVDTGKYLVSQEVISCFQGETKNVYNSETQYAKITMPVYDINMQKIVGVMVLTTSAKSVIDLAENYQVKTGILEVVVVMLMLPVGFFLSSFCVKPLNRIRKAISLAEDGNLEPMAVNDFQETAQISQAYNQTLARLKTLDESRDEFVSNVSHELKTPITSIRVLADSLLSMEGAPVELYQEFMRDISEEIDRESTIIEDLLTLVRMDRSATELKVSQVNLNELLESLLKRLKPLAAKRQIELIFESFRPVMAEVDEVKLSLALTNLVENAIKYNVEGGWVKVTLNADHKFFYVKVQDNGIGIPESDQDHVFERFYRVDKARSRETGGTGLGLAITKNVVQMHRGAIKVYSKNQEGTTFTVRIPLTYIE